MQEPYNNREIIAEVIHAEGYEAAVRQAIEFSKDRVLGGSQEEYVENLLWYVCDLWFRDRKDYVFGKLMEKYAETKVKGGD